MLEEHVPDIFKKGIRVHTSLLIPKRYHIFWNLQYYCVSAWLGIPILDSVPWDGRNSEFRFRVPEPRTFRRKLKSENLKTPLVKNRNSGSYFSGIPEFRL